MEYVRCRICDSKILVSNINFSDELIDDIKIKEIISLIGKNNLHSFCCPFCEYSTESFKFLEENKCI
jgi:hypothetical protein